MHYREYPASPPLDRLIRCYWTLEESAAEATEHKVVPDGCMEVIFHLADRLPPRLEDGSLVDQPRTFVVGQIRGPVTLVPEGRIETLGIRLRPGGAFALLCVPLDQLVEEAPSLDVLAPRLFADVAERVAGAATWEARVRLLDGMLHQRLAPALPAARLAEVAAGRIAATRGALSIDALAQDLGSSRRTLERVFRAEVGLGPKLLARIARFQHALKRLGNPALRWGDIAHATGYADQSHLVRDFHEFAGEAPTAFAKAGHELTTHFAGLAGKRR